jgi:predicted metal-dependent phosphoesterase TrpH
MPLRGDFHVHSRHSDGKEEPAVVCANYRRDGFDFLAITDHRRYFPSLRAIEAYKNIPTGLKIYANL